MTASTRARQIATAAAIAASDKLAREIVALDVSETLVITDIFLVCTAANERQVAAIVDAIEEALDRLDIDPVRREGTKENRWVLLDYLEVVVHVQQDEERDFYGLDRLWRDCPVIALDLSSSDGVASGE